MEWPRVVVQLLWERYCDFIELVAAFVIHILAAGFNRERIYRLLAVRPYDAYCGSYATLLKANVVY